MSTVVKTINDALKARVVAVLGSSYSELRFIFNVEDNGLRTSNKGFGVVPGPALPVTGPTKAITLNQTFEVALTRTVAREQDDTSRIKDLLETLYDDIDNIMVDVVNTQLGIPLTVFDVFDPSISAPEFLESLIVLRISFTIKWRRLLT